MITELISYLFSRIAHYFRTKRLAKSITLAFFLFVFVGIARALYLFFRWGLAFVVKDVYLRDAMPLFVYELFFLIIIFLVIVGGLTVGLLGLFRNKKDAWIIVSPKYKIVPLFVYIRVFVGSLVPLLVIALPAVWGVKDALELTAWGTTLAFFSVIFLVAFSSFLSIITIFVVAKLVRVISFLFGRFVFSFKIFAISLIIIFLFVGTLSFVRIARSDVAVLFRPDVPQLLSVDTGVISQTFRFFPSHISALVLFSLQEGDEGRAESLIFDIFVLCFISLVLLFLVSRWYLVLWQIIQEGRFVFSFKKRILLKPLRFPRYFMDPVGAIFEKEALILFRDLKNALWLFFLFFIWLIQAGLNFFLRKNILKHGVDVSTVPELLLALQILVVVYFVSAFVLRFTFSSFSMERKTSWILRSAPLDIKKVFWAKFFFYSFVFMFLGILVSALNIFALNVSFMQSLLFLTFTLISIVFVTTLGLGLGALFPNFETDDPQILSTTLPGIGFILSSLVYGACGALLVYFFLTRGGGLGLLAFEVFSFVVIWLFLRFAPRSLQGYELTTGNRSARKNFRILEWE